MIALGFALEAVAALMRGDVWWKWTGALVMGILFLVAGIKSQQIKLKVGTRFAHYLNLRPIWMVVLVVFSVYFLQKPAILDFIMNLHQRWQGWFGYAVFGLVGAILLSGYWWLTGAMLKPATQPAATKKPTTAAQDDKPPTLLDLFKKDFSNTMKVSDDEPALSVTSKNGATIKIRRQVYMDFPAKAKFVGFYIYAPSPPSADISGEETFIACSKLVEADAVQQAFEHFSKQVAVLAGQGEQMTSIQDLTFSGRVLIYHEEFLSIPQKAEILKAYGSKGFAVTFMGNDYLGTQVISWHQQHDAKLAH
jgi:hypothetical protein